MGKRFEDEMRFRVQRGRCQGAIVIVVSTPTPGFDGGLLVRDAQLELSDVFLVGWDDLEPWGEDERGVREPRRPAPSDRGGVATPQE